MGEPDRTPSGWFRAVALLLFCGGCYGNGGCPDAIAACRDACKGSGGMASFGAEHGCACNAVDGGAR